MLMENAFEEIFEAKKRGELLKITSSDETFFFNEELDVDVCIDPSVQKTITFTFVHQGTFTKQNKVRELDPERQKDE